MKLQNITKNNMKKNFYDAIILSSTFKENKKELIKFLCHLCNECKSVENFYRVIPVLVFEEIELDKFKTIKRFFKKGHHDIFPKILLNRNSKGFSACLNYGISKTNSNFILRIDTDDTCTKERIFEQINAMYKYNLDLCSSYMKDERGNILKYPLNFNTLLIWTALGSNPIAHPSVCLRRTILLNTYNEELLFCEDFDLWMRLFLSRNLKFKCLNKTLVKYNLKNAYLKDYKNALNQLKIRFRILRKIFILTLPIFFGIFPNFLRIIFRSNLLLKLRRRV